ncbi:MAG: choice-of-anchor D domain-containing protein [Frankiales bacterium]|nr:choice-of-anchor D domain-containing protein [Frankiales bacterium]
MRPAALLALLALVATMLVQTRSAPDAQAASPVSGQVTRGADTNRTNWYRDQPLLTPNLVHDPTQFGQLFSTQVTGQIYAQPVVALGSVAGQPRQILIVATEENRVYGLDADTGAEIWHRQFGAPFDPTTLSTNQSCLDLKPHIGITSTPVVDTTTGRVYVVDNEYKSGTSGPDTFYLRALNLNDGTDAFPPRELIGTSRGNDFNATQQSQRPGLLLLDGHVYAAFSAHCQVPPWSGWIFGVDAGSGAITTVWSDHTQNTTNPGGGIWMSGGGLASDGSGNILAAIGNAFQPDVNNYDRTNQPTEWSNAVVRLHVDTGASSVNNITVNDFFRPCTEGFLDQNDLDLGSGGIALLPEAQFGTSSHPRLVVAAGKEGYVYLLDRDNLGGQRASCPDSSAVVGVVGPNGGVWSQPSVWGGDGGYVYIPTAGPGSQAVSWGQGRAGNLYAYKYGVDASGTPTLSKVATSSTAWGFGSSNVVVTSNGTADGSALLWAVMSSTPGDGGGVPNARLVALKAVPTSGGDFAEVRSFAVGTATKFTPPGIGPNGHVYVGTYDGHVLGYGPLATSPLTASTVSFPATVVNGSSSGTATFTAHGSSTITALDVAKGPFTSGTPSVNGTAKALPLQLHDGDTVTVPVTFHPTTTGAAAGILTASTSSPAYRIGADLSGTGVESAARLTITPGTLDLGTLAVKSAPAANTVTLTNAGQTSLTFGSVSGPNPPFSVTGAPPNGSTLAGGQSVSVTVSFAPPKDPGTFADSITFHSDAGNVTLHVSGAAAPPGHLALSRTSLPFGTVPVGSSRQISFTLKNDGGTPFAFAVAKAPARADFHGDKPIPEGTTLAPGETITRTVTFSPQSVGAQNDAWTLTPTTGQGVLQVTMSGTGQGRLANATRPRVSGRPLVGHGLVASTGTWTATPDTGTTTYSYHWLRDGHWIPGATSSHYHVVAADAGHDLQVRVSAQRAGYASSYAYSVRVAVPRVPLQMLAAPAFRGTAAVGSFLYGWGGRWDPRPTAGSFHWLKDGRVLNAPVATRSRFRPGPSWRGHRISLQLRVGAIGYLPRTYTTASVLVR